MVCRKFFFFLILLLFVNTAYSQRKFSKIKQTSKSLLQQAQGEMEKSPTEAILLVERAITIAKKNEKDSVDEEAYFLLGKIYEQIGQNELALQRYNQALLRSNKLKRSTMKVGILERMGAVNLELENAEEAEKYYSLCLKVGSDKKMLLKCEEGLIDVKLLQRKNKEVEIALNDIISNYELDSTDVARVEARKSQNYYQQDDYTNARSAYSNSIDNLPRNTVPTKEEYRPIEKAQKDLLTSDEVDDELKVDIRNSIAVNEDLNIRPESQIEGGLQLVEYYVAERDLPKAASFINNTKKLIKPTTDANLTAEIFKKSSELNQRLGKISVALEDVENYKIAKEKSLSALETSLQQQIEIVKSQKQLDLSQKDSYIEEKDQQLLQNQLRTQKILIGFLSAIILGSLIFFYFLYKNVKEKRKANQKLLLKSLRNQMNPHFIFNALNSVNNFIAKNDEKAANKFLAEFSKLMRMVLDYSQKDFISFEEEIELNELYLKLEHFRFRDKFNYTFKNNTSMSGGVDIPPMLVQPFIENAVWHGLRYKEDTGSLDINIDETDEHISVSIKDDGIGRHKSKSLKTKNQKKYKSTGMENVTKRIDLINELYQKEYKIIISDLHFDKEDTGTIVEILIPKN